MRELLCIFRLPNELKITLSKTAASSEPPVKYLHKPITRISDNKCNLAQCRDVDKDFTAGVDDYIGKPFDLNLLKVKIDNIIQNRKLLQREFIGDRNLSA